MAEGEGTPPPEVAHVWGWFWQLHARRRYGMAGADPIAFQDIEAWARLTGTAPHPWEVWLITHLDDALRNKKPADPEKTEPPAGDGAVAVHALMSTLTGRKAKKDPAKTAETPPASDRTKRAGPAPQ